jgi:hypothetical protein
MSRFGGMGGSGEWYKLEVGETATFMFSQTRTVTTQFGDAMVMDGKLQDGTEISFIVKPQMGEALDKAIAAAGRDDIEVGGIVTMKREQDVATPAGKKHIHSFTYAPPAGGPPPAAAAAAPEPEAAPDPAAFFNSAA